MISKIKGVGIDTQPRDIFLIPLSVAFFIVAGGVASEAASMHRVWFVVNLFNGVGGAILFVYPWDALRVGWDQMCIYWWRMMLITFLCFIASTMISSYLGLGDVIF